VSASGERRIVTVLVTDVVDSTAIMERLGPERSKFLFDEIVGLMADQVRRFDGTVAQLTGDGVLALFGAPAAHGDDAERAVRAALGIHDSLARYAADVADAYGIELAARVAVNTGPVVVPTRDATPDVLYNALGDTVNVAARLQSHAGVGGVAVGPATARELAGRFALEPLGELPLKGKTDPVAAFRVFGEAEPELAAESPMVGRSTELATLVSTLERLEDGVGSIVTVTGEPGIGKSRLVAEARSQSTGDARVLIGNATSYTTQSPFWPVRDLLRSWLGLGVSEPEGRLRLELKAALADAVDDEAEGIYPFLASVMGVVLEGHDAQRLRDLSRDSVQRQTFEAIATLLEAVTREQPLCVVFEDLHWADESTLELLEELVELADRAAITFVLLYRSEREHGSWHLGERARQRFPHRLVELDVRSLTPEDSKLLAAGAAGGDLPDAVTDLLASRAGGNPFFLEEALHDLLERGVLRPVNAHWELTIAAEQVSVPLLVQEALQARLDRLEPGTREVASIASVIGQTFGLPLLERLADRGRLLPALSELQRLDLVVEERRRPAPEYRFRHGLVQEVAYTSLTEARRRGLHLAAGNALEDLHADTPQEAYEALARHFSEAGASGKAIEYLLKAGDAAWALYADRAALVHYRRALEFMRADDPRGRELQLKIALAHHLDFDFGGADAAWARGAASPGPAPVRATKVERLVTACVPFDRFGVVPGLGYSPIEWLVTGALFSGLLRYERDLTVGLDAAAELRVSDDGLRYRARLRSDAVWSDGAPLSAHDFAFGWRAIRESRLPTAHLLDDVAEATALDERTLEIRLHHPRPYFPHLLTVPATFPWPAHRSEEAGEAWLDSPDVTNGPFVLAERDDQHISLVANESWPRTRGNIHEVVHRFMSQDEQIAAWQRQDIDLQFWPWLQGPDARKLPESAVVEQAAWLTTVFAGFVADAAPFSDVSVRRAFAHALDRDRIAEIGWRGEPARTGGVVPQAMPGHSHRIGLDHDPSRARELLAAAGYPGGRGLPEIRLASPFSSASELVATQWREELGASVTVVLMPVDGDPRTIDPPVACWVHGWTADFPDPAGHLIPMLGSTSGHTAALYRDRDVTDLMDRFLAARTRDARLGLAGELEHIWLSEKVALVPLVYPSQTWLRRPRVEGFWMSPIMPGHLSDIVIRR
jgi:ABC-type transport system substrate-binding protein/class 3 adenylate cyclase